MIAYASMYGNTEAAANYLATTLVKKGMTNVAVYDVSKTHVSYLIAETFKYSHMALAAVTYNLGIYPPMLDYLHDMKALNLQKRTVALIESGSWAPQAGKLMRRLLTDMKGMTILDNELTLTSAMKEDDSNAMDAIADGIIESMK